MNKKIYLSIVIVTVICVVLIGTIIIRPSESFEVIQRIPEGTQSGEIEYGKTVHSPFNKISVIFNHDVDESSLTKDTFYALQGINDKAPGVIEYESNTRTAFLIFNQSIEKPYDQGIIRITVVVEGVKDLKGKEVEKLLYSIDIND